MPIRISQIGSDLPAKPDSAWPGTGERDWDVNQVRIVSRPVSRITHAIFTTELHLASMVIPTVKVMLNRYLILLFSDLLVCLFIGFFLKKATERMIAGFIPYRLFKM